MIAVLDTSAAVEVVLQRQVAEKFSLILRKANWIIAPYLYISEVTNVFWKYNQFGNLEYEECRKRMEQAISLPDNFINETDLFQEAFKQSCVSSHSVYDMMYLILARRHNAILLTMDKKLKKTAIELSVDI